MSAPNNLAICLAVLAAGLTGCSRAPESAEADNKVLCDLSTGYAYYVRPGSIDASFVNKVRSGDDLCERLAAIGADSKKGGR